MSATVTGSGYQPDQDIEVLVTFQEKGGDWTARRKLTTTSDASGAWTAETDPLRPPGDRSFFIKLKIRQGGKTMQPSSESLTEYNCGDEMPKTPDVKHTAECLPGGKLRLAFRGLDFTKSTKMTIPFTLQLKGGTTDMQEGVVGRSDRDGSFEIFSKPIKISEEEDYLVHYSFEILEGDSTEARSKGDGKQGC